MKELFDLLLRKNITVATAESCTGGNIAAEFVSYPGISSVFLAGLVTYANSAKEKYVGVPESVLSEYGAVSEQTARLMAKGIREAAHSDIGISVTGIAGPTGGTEQKQVGTVYVGLCTDKKCEARLVFTDPNDAGEENVREYIRKSTVLEALKWAERELTELF